jgi:anaerobic ribonucleoside-triphosphate reductase
VEHSIAPDAEIKRMDRKMLTDHLLMAQRHVIQAQDIVFRQQELVSRLERDGHDVASARKLLEEFHRTLASHIADRERIRAALENTESPG